MKIKLLFFMTLSLLLSSCYTRYVYVYTDEPVNEVYIYDVNYVYDNLWYDDFYWRYDVGNYYNFGLYFYSPRYWAYSNYYGYKPYYKHYRHKHHWYKPRKLKRRYNVVKNHHYRPKRHIMWEKTNTKFEYKPKQSVQVKPKNQHKYNIQTKKRDQVVTKREMKQRPYMSSSKNKHKITQRKTTKIIKRNVQKMSRSKWNNSFKKSTQVSKDKPKFRKKTNTIRNKIKRSTSIRNKKSTKKGRR